MQQSSKNIVLITGANKGIGLETARQLAQAGHTVLLGARNPSLGQEAARKLQAENLDARFIEIDLARREIIEAAAASIKTEFKHLDILVNNAGINDPADGPPSVADLAAIQRIMESNFLGHIAVTQAMLPLLRSSTTGRIVNVSSDLGSLARHGDPDWKFVNVKLIGYCASKSALNMFTVQLAYELRDTAIKVNSANPGFTATDLNGNRGHQTVEEGASEIVRLAVLPQDGPTGGFFEADGPIPW